MIINFTELSSRYDKAVLEMLESALSAAMPDLALRKIIKNSKIFLGKEQFNFSKYGHIFTVGIGKAADSMTKVLNSLINLDGGIIVIPEEQESLLKTQKFKILYGGHPLPNRNSILASKTILKFLKEKEENDLIIFLISGGASSLVSLPDGITLAEKKIVTNLLLKSGANIDEINCVRKHLSGIKGGRLAQYVNCDAISLVMSDVIGDNLSTIASGTTYCDKTTFSDAKKILQKYNLQKIVPESVLKRINFGIQKKIDETPKRPRIKNFVIATNADCLLAMKKTAARFGLFTKIISPISGEAKHAAKKLVKLIPKKPNSCVIFGGETTVKVVGRGKGGRNQELVLSALSEIQKIDRTITIASMGTDGKDGNTDTSGAIASNFIIYENNIQSYLDRNNSYYFFKKHGGLIFTGPTHTNLMDIGVILGR